MSIPQIPEGSLLTAAAKAPKINIETIAPKGTVLIVNPHPDDETFGCGLAMAAAAMKGRNIAIVLLTDGEGSHPDAKSFTQHGMAELRSSEFARALRLLVPTRRVDVLRLHLPDGKSCYEPTLAGEVLKFARARGVSAIWSTWDGDPHCDHETAAALARNLAHHLKIPHWSFAVWGRFGERVVPSDLCTFDAPILASRKREAIAAYRSQIDPNFIDDQGGFIMPTALVAHFAVHPEIFVCG